MVICARYRDRVHRGRQPPELPAGPSLATARLNLVDGFACHLGGQALNLPPSTHRLLAYLALQSAPPTRSAAAGALWPDVAEQQARATLRSTIWRLLRLGPDLLVASSDRILLSPTVQVDAWEQWRHGHALIRAGATMTEAELDGPRLGGWLLPGWSDDWTVVARERLHQVQLHGLEALARRMLALGRHCAALQAAMQAVQLDPLRESPYRLLTEIHLDEGNVVEALRCYDTLRQLLHVELSVAPSARFEELIRPHLPRGPSARPRPGTPRRPPARGWA